MHLDDFFKHITDPDAADPYEVLGLQPGDDEAAVKRAYFQKVREFPPEAEPEKFQEVRSAYEQLRDEETRSLLELFRLQPPQPLPNRRKPKYDLSVHIEDLVHLVLQDDMRPMEKDFLDLETI